MLKSYLPALIFILLGLITGGAFVFLNKLLGPSRPGKVKSDPYECGLPSDVQQNFRFGISFYLVAMLFILFDIEAAFLYPWAVTFRDFAASKWFVLGEMGVFLAILISGYLYLWWRGALQWD